MLYCQCPAGASFLKILFKGLLGLPTSYSTLSPLLSNPDHSICNVQSLFIPKPQLRHLFPYVVTFKVQLLFHKNRLPFFSFAINVILRTCNCGIIALWDFGIIISLIKTQNVSVNVVQHGMTPIHYIWIRSIIELPDSLLRCRLSAIRYSFFTTIHSTHHFV